MDYKLILDKTLNSLNSPNLILSGHDKLNKMTILNNYLIKMNSSPPVILEKYKINWSSNPIYKIFDMKNIKYKYLSLIHI